MPLEGQARPKIFSFLIADLINKCTYYPLGMQFPNREVLMHRADGLVLAGLTHCNVYLHPLKL